MAKANSLSFSVTLPYKLACDLPDCSKPTNRVTRVNLDKNVIGSFCSAEHSRIGIARWQEKIAKGIWPGQKVIKDEPEMIGDNLEEITNQE